MILVIGDLHIRDELAYADYIPDRRMAERETVFDKIIESSKDCDKIVLLGDSLNSKNNSSESIKIFVDFIKKLQDNKRKIYILAGNHDKYANGKSAIDFLDKLKDENICTITKSNYRDDKLVFAPFTYPNEIGTNDLKKAANELFETMGDGDILFTHQAIAGTKTQAGQTTDMFHEIVLNRDLLEKKYKLIFAGHIHTPQRIGNTIITGSVFTQEMNEYDKYIWKVNELNYEVQQIKLPGRHIIKVENPTLAIVQRAPNNTIYKAVFTKKLPEEEMEKIMEALKEKDAYILVEQYEQPRKKTNLEALDLDVINLLKAYAEQNKVDVKELLTAFELVK